MECINPLFVRKSGIFVRCGRCEPCIEQRSKEWAVRLGLDMDRAETAYFVTLTYDDSELAKLKVGHLDSEIEYLPGEAPCQDDYSSMVPKLDKSHLRHFLMNLRNYQERGMPNHYHGKKVSQIALKAPKFKYFAVGEYGTRTNRPHWHILFFNVPYDMVNFEKVVTFAWGKGFTYFGTVTMSSITYTVGYMLKNLHKKCIRLMSKGIGGMYASEKVEYHQARMKPVVRVAHSNAGMPRYIKERVFTSDQRNQFGESERDRVADLNLQDPYRVERAYKHLKAKINFKNQKRK